MGRPARSIKRQGATEPLLICPFTGKEIEIVFNERVGMFYAKFGPGKMFTTALYGDRAALLYDLSYRDGVKPEFPRTHVISVSAPGDTPPPNPFTDRVAGMKETEARVAEILKG